MKKALIFLALAFSVLSLSCETTEPSIDKTRLSITSLDASVSEVFLKLQVQNPRPNEKIELKRNGITVMSFNSNRDTILVDTSLTENTAYTYSISAMEGGKVTSLGESISVNTLIPSGHDFEFQTFLYGNADPSVLTDVAIIDENNIWAVGEIYMKDSLGNVIFKPFNAVHFDGKEWKMINIPTIDRTYTSYWSDYLEAIYALDENDIWVTTGGQMVHFDGKSWGKWQHLAEDLYDTKIGSIRKIWINKDHEAYAVGNRENVWHYSGSGKWKQLVTEGNYTLFDIWGIRTPSGEDKIICSGSNPPSSSSLFEVKGDKVTPIYRTSDKVLISTWFINPYNIYSSGTSVFAYKACKMETVFDDPYYFFKSVRGAGSNDIMVSGSPGFVAHYSGKDVKYFALDDRDAYISMAYNNGVVVMVGRRGEKAVLTIGKRISHM